MNPIREMRVHVACLIKVYDEAESPSKGTFLNVYDDPDLPMRGRVVEI